MHWLPVYVSALLLTVPALAAQTTGTELPPLVTDAKGDVTMTPLGGPTQPASGFDAVDLLALWLHETPDDLLVKAALAKMDGQPGPSQASVQAFFVFDGVEYRVGMYRSSDNEAWFGSLGARKVGEPFFRATAPLAARYDVAAGQVWTSIDRDLLPGGSGRAMARDDVLTGVYAKAMVTLGYAATFNDPTIPVQGALLDVADRVPDVDGASLTLQFGGAQGVGGLSLTAANPFRASNGADGTYVFDVEAANRADAPRTLRLEAQHVPSGWNVSLPGTSLRLEAGAAASFQVAVQTPFFHDHGTSQTFHLRMVDPQDADAWAQVELGIHYLAVPQPAGHHDTLFLHSHPWSGSAAVVNPFLGGTSGVLTFNTLEQDPEDAKVPLTAYSSIGSTNDFYGWAGCLDPGLAMGLDFDTSRTGVLRLPVFATKLVPDAVLTGRLLIVRGGNMQYCFPSEYRTLDVEEVATLEASVPRQVGPNGMEILESVVRAKADVVAFEPGAALVLELSLRGSGPGIGGAGGPELRPGGFLRLPLEEYTDAAPSFVAWSDHGGAGADGLTFLPASPEPAEQSPGLGLAVLALALVVLAGRRR